MFDYCECVYRSDTNSADDYGTAVESSNGNGGGMSSGIGGKYVA